MYAKTTALRFRSELGLSKKQIEQIFAEENGEIDENEENLDLALKNMECQSEVSVASSTGSLGKFKCLWPRCNKIFENQEDLNRHVFCHEIT